MEARRLRIVALALLLVALFATLRLLDLDGDPPWPLPNGQPGQELVVEGPAKAHEARKWALFGAFDTHPADQYRFWRAQSPVYVYPLAGWLREVGVGWAQLKTFGVLATGVGFCVLLALAVRRWGARGMAAAGVMLGVHFYSIHYCRAGLLEPYLNTWAILTVAFGLLALRDLRWSIGMQWGLAGALLVKLSAAYLVPLALGITFIAHRRAHRRGAPKGQHALILGHGALLGAALVWYMLSEPYWRTVEWNFVHMVHDEKGFETPDLTDIPGLAVLGRMVDIRRLGNGLALVFPVMLWPAVLRLGVTLRALFLRFVRRRDDAEQLHDLDVVAAIWLLSAWGILQLTPLVRVRFSMILFPPMTLMAAGGLMWLLDRFAERRRVQLGIVAVGAVALLATHGWWQLRWLREHATQIHDNNVVMAKAVAGKKATIVGHYGSSMTFDSDADYFFAKRHFNLSEEVLDQLPFTHVFSRIGKRDSIRKRVPWRFVGAEPIAEAAFRDRTWQLLELAPRDP